MKKIIFLLMFIFILNTFAETYVYENNDLKIERTIEITSEPKLDIIREVQTEGFNTNITINIKNNAIPKKSIEIKENINYIPKDMKYTLYPEGEVKEERIKWKFENVGTNEEIKMSIIIKGELKNFENISSPYLEIENKNIILIPPTIGRIGDEMLLTAITEDNEAVPELEILSISPSQKEEIILTDSRGVAKITPQEKGTYSFKISKIETVESYSVEVEELSNKELTTAYISNDELNAGDLIPFVIGVIFIALLIFGMVLYFAPKHERDPKPEDFIQAFGEKTEETEGRPEWMKNEKFFSEKTIEKESLLPKNIETPVEQTVLEEPKKTQITKIINKENKIGEIKTKTKIIAENRKKIAEKNKKTIERIKEQKNNLSRTNSNIKFSSKNKIKTKDVINKKPLKKRKLKK
ncbi:MAG: hypothetical protein WC356_03195 [Candidatus Micrarchaeia archaeon]|jgi:hypothetical protein